MSQESIGGSKYFVSFKDDCSAFRIIYFIKHKSEVLKKLEEFVNFVENKFQRSIKILRVDNSKEWKNAEISTWEGNQSWNELHPKFYTSEQNERAERDNKLVDY